MFKKRKQINKTRSIPQSSIEKPVENKPADKKSSQM
jgi:hypothetical protein